MEDRIETLDRARRRMLLGGLVAFVAWQVPLILREAMPAALPGAVAAGVALLSILGAVVWAVYLVRMRKLGRTLRQEPAVEATLNDERVKDVRLRAFTFGFWMISAFLVAVRIANLAVELPVGVVVQLGIVLSVVAVISAFLVLDRG